VVAAHHGGEVDDRVAGDPASEVDVRVEIAERQRSRRREHRTAAMQPRIAGASNRAPPPASPVNEYYVVERVDRLDAQDQRRKTMLLEDDGGEQRRLQTVRTPLADHAAKRSQRRPPARLLVVGQRVEMRLHGGRRSERCDQPPLARAELRARRWPQGDWGVGIGEWGDW